MLGRIIPAEGHVDIDASQAVCPGSQNEGLCFEVRIMIGFLDGEVAPERRSFKGDIPPGSTDLRDREDGGRPTPELLAYQAERLRWNAGEWGMQLVLFEEGQCMR